MARFSKGVYTIGTIFIVAAGLAYIFWGGDIIPESFLTKIGPAAILSYIDDAIVLLGMVFALRRWKTIWMPEKSSGSRKINYGIAAIWISVLSVVIWYVTLGVDLIPDKVPWIGLMDDAAAIFGGMIVAARLRQTFFPKKNG